MVTIVKNKSGKHKGKVAGGVTESLRVVKCSFGISRKAATSL